MKTIRQLGACVAVAFFFVATPAFAATSDYTNFWSFDDATGKSVRDIGGQNGVLVGSSTGLGWAGGKIGTALGMDGLDGEGVALPNSFLTGSQGTLSVWFRMEQLNSRNVIFSGKSTSDNNVYVLLSVDYEGRPQLQFRTDPGGSDRKVQGMTILNRNEWYNLVLTANTVSYKLYVNGEEIGVAGENLGRWFPDFTNQVLSYRIGMSEANPLLGSFNGMIDELRLYSRALTMEEVTSLYNEGNAGKPTVPLAIRPTLAFSISSDSIEAKGSVTLNWTAAKVDSCTASGDWSGALDLSGSRVMSNLGADQVYAIACTGKGGPIDSTVRVRVGTATPSVTAGVGTLTVTSVPLDDKPRGMMPILVSSFSRNLTVGSRGEDVTRLQELLIGRGYLASNATGYFGQLTKAALIKLQKERALPATGFFGPMTRAVLASGNR